MKTPLRECVAECRFMLCHPQRLMRGRCFFSFPFDVIETESEVIFDELGPMHNDFEGRNIAQTQTKK